MYWSILSDDLSLLGRLQYINNKFQLSQSKLYTSEWKTEYIDPIK